MPGVKIVESEAFWCCKYLADVECDKLERIGSYAFHYCPRLRSINLTSVEIVEKRAFSCYWLTDVKFGDQMESMGGGAFNHCASLERIAIPLSNRIIDDRDDEASYHDDVFQCCEDLKHVDLIGGVHENIAALHLEDWRNDMNAAIDAINQILPNTPSGIEGCDYIKVGEKDRAVKRWIRSVLRKIVDNKQQHCNILAEATATLVEELVLLPQDIVVKLVLHFLELPSYTFELEEQGN